MDKIRAAIAKARADRSAPQRRLGPDLALDPAAAPPRAPGRMPGQGLGVVPAADAGAADPWAALTPAAFDAAGLRRHRIVAYQRGAEAAAIDMMRTRILQQMRQNGWRRLAITSATAACGKSTIALNLAVSLSRQRELRSLLLDLDLRRPSLAAMLGVAPRPADLAEVLRGTADLDRNAVCFAGNLAVGVSAEPAVQTAELLGGAGIGAVLAGIEARYQPDILICDTPPMLAADDMMAFAAHVDCVLIVAAADRTTTRDIDICEQDLARQTNVLGVVLNACRHMGPAGQYGYYD